MRIAGVDPGGTTGVVLIEAALPKDELLLELQECHQLGVPDNHKHHKELAALLHVLEPDLVVTERFENRNDNEFAKLVSLEYIGVVEEVCQRHDIPLLYQGASQAKGWATNSKLQKLNLLTRPLHPWRHANDASRHVTYFLCASTKAPVWALSLRPRILRKLKW